VTGVIQPVNEAQLVKSTENSGLNFEQISEIWACTLMNSLDFSDHCFPCSHSIYLEVNICILLDDELLLVLISWLKYFIHWLGELFCDRKY